MGHDIDECFSSYIIYPVQYINLKFDKNNVEVKKTNSYIGSN